MSLPRTIPAVVLTAAVLLATGAGATPREVVIFHTSDIHGGVAPRAARWHKENPKRMLGGFGALSRLLARETRPYALLDSGDIFQGTPEGNLTEGRIVIAAMNRLGYDAMVIGNHEYDYGESALVNLWRMARFPFVAANITRKSDGRPVHYAVPTVMLHVGGLKIGVVGLATHKTRTSTLPKNVAHLDFHDEVKAAKKHAAALRQAGAQVVIALTHCGLSPTNARKRISGRNYTPSADDLRYRGDLAIARGADVDLVLGGHMHTGLDGGWKDPESGVWIFQAFERLEAVNRIVLRVDDENATNTVKLVGVEARLVDLWIDEYGEDPEMIALLDTYRADVKAALDAVVGTASRALTRDGLDSQLGNWLSDVMRQKAKADVAIQNTFGIRADLDAGPIRVRDLYEVMPFENTLATATLTGSQLQRLVRQSLRGGKVRLQFSGLTAAFKIGPNDAVVDLVINVGGKPLENDSTYRVATNNYLASGGSGGRVFNSVEVTDTGVALRQLFIDDVKSRGTLEPPPLGRIVRLP